MSVDRRAVDALIGSAPDPLMWGAYADALEDMRLTDESALLRDTLWLVANRRDVVNERQHDETQKRVHDALRVHKVKALPAVFVNSIGMKLVPIPAGTFLMGSTQDEAGRYDDEGPQRLVTVNKCLLLGQFAVTQAEWRAIMNSDPSEFKGADLPVEMVSHLNAVEFCKKLTSKEKKEAKKDAKEGKKNSCLPNTDWKYRLPTEAEWEFACRAGTTTAFYFGEPISADLCNYDASCTYQSSPKGEYRQKTIAVESFLPNPFGLYQMHGNVLEHCSDWINKYAEAAETNPTGQADGTYRVQRGGCWENIPRLVRSAQRRGAAPDHPSRTTGFRVALEL